MLINVDIIMFCLVLRLNLYSKYHAIRIGMVILLYPPPTLPDPFKTFYTSSLTASSHSYVFTAMPSATYVSLDSLMAL